MSPRRRASRFGAQYTIDHVKVMGLPRMWHIVPCMCHDDEMKIMRRKRSHKFPWGNNIGVLSTK